MTRLAISFVVFSEIFVDLTKLFFSIVYYNDWTFLHCHNKKYFHSFMFVIVSVVKWYNNNLLFELCLKSLKWSLTLEIPHCNEVSMTLLKHLEPQELWVPKLELFALLLILFLLFIKIIVKVLFILEDFFSPFHLRSAQRAKRFLWIMTQNVRFMRTGHTSVVYVYKFVISTLNLIMPNELFAFTFLGYSQFCVDNSSIQCFVSHSHF